MTGDQKRSEFGKRIFQKRYLASAFCLVALALALNVSTAYGAFGLHNFNVAFTEESGSPATQAGSHPFAVTTAFEVNVGTNSKGEPFPDGGQLKSLNVLMPVGFTGNPTFGPRCTASEFVTVHSNGFNDCSNNTVVGATNLVLQKPPNPGNLENRAAPVYNLVPPPGAVAEIGFLAFNIPITIPLRAKQNEPDKVTADLSNIPQAGLVYFSKVEIWGVPGDHAHDPFRGTCLRETTDVSGNFVSTGACESSAGSSPFLVLPRACNATPRAEYEATSWNPVSAPDRGSLELPAMTGCEKLTFAPTADSKPTSSASESPSGLDFRLDVNDPGLTESTGLADSDIEKAVVALPEGVTTNPAVASGLAACTLAQYQSETLDSSPGTGCPEASKIGSVEAETPILTRGEDASEGLRVLNGSIYIAKQHDNPFDSLLAIYMVIKDPQLGVLVSLAGKVEPEPRTGRLTTTFDDLPQVPLSEVRFHFRTGQRAPLITPPVCGIFATEATLYPQDHSLPPVQVSPTFEINQGAPGFGCSSTRAGLPTTTSFSAGTTNPQAGAYSPFILNLSRPDGSQQLSRIGTTLPVGLLGRLAGIPYCPESGIAQAASRTGEGEGAEEIASPSCPASSRVGTVTATAGAGSEPLIVTGRAYLAGPYKGAPLSLEIITPAIAGPFDLGVVVVRTALLVDPLTTQITAESDPIPTILHGLPLDLRSISIDMDRPDFTLNPTSCEPKSITGTATSTLGSVASLSQYFQASNCASLKFRPTLKLSLKGQTKRTGHPALKAVLTYPKAGAYANVGRAQVNLPHSEFIEQNNLNRTCTKPVLLEGKCPKSTIYGKAKAWTPLLDKPLEGDVYLVGGFGYKLPALVAELDGEIRVLLAGKVDSGPNKGIRNTFEAVPDAPVEKFELNLRGGPKYSLLVNSENLCKKPQKAIARFTAQNGKVLQMKPVIANSCKKQKDKGHGGKH
jgi:hypothetical protein